MKWESKKFPPRKPRFPARLQATVQLGGEEYSCIVVNLSRTGIMLVGDIPPAPDTHEVDLVLDPTGDLRADLRGRIVRVQTRELAKTTLMALELVNLDAEQEKAIESLVLFRAVEA